MAEAVSDRQSVFGELFSKFIRKTPLAVMAQALIERFLGGEWIDELFDQRRDDGEPQYTRTLLFSQVVAVMVAVVTRSTKSVNAYYNAHHEELSVTVQALYGKLARTQPAMSVALFHGALVEQQEILESLSDEARARLVPGRQVRILDGNCIAATHHRLKPLRETAAGPLPGKSLVVYDPDADLMVDLIPCEDGHTQERALVQLILRTLEAAELWIADRNFCFFDFLWKIVDAKSDVLVRHHAGMAREEIEPKGVSVSIPGGTASESRVRVRSEDGRSVEMRAVHITLDEKTRDGETTLILLTSLPQEVADTAQVAALYLKRWRIETAFQKLERDLHSEVQSLGYPKAALLAFCISVIAYNTYSIIQAALRAAHGAEAVDGKLSHYKLADEIQRPHYGMMAVVPVQDWQRVSNMKTADFILLIWSIACNVMIKSLIKAPTRKRKTPRPKRKYDPAQPHVSTYRLLEEAKQARRALRGK